MRLIYAILSTFIVLASMNSFAQCPPATMPTFTATSTPSVCASDGSITVFASGGLPPYVYSITAGPQLRPGQASNVFNGLPSGTYTVEVRDNCNLTFSSNVIVGGNYTNPTIGTVTIVKVSCPGGSDGELTANVIGGTAPFSYSLIAPSPVLLGPQMSNHFSGLPAGNYTMQVKDQCANIATKIVTLSTEITSVPNILSNYANWGQKYACDSMHFNIQFYPALYPFALPLTYEITAGQVIVPPQSSSEFWVPQGGDYTFRVTDACGRTDVHTFTTEIFPIVSSSENCGTFSINILGKNTLSPTYAIVSGPVQFPHQSSGNFTGLPAGTYTLEIKDFCGQIKQVVRTLTPSGAALSVSKYWQRPNCNVPNVDFRLSIQNGTSPYTITHLSGPTNFGSITAYSTFPSILNLIPGSYSIKVVDNCGQVDTFDFTADESYWATTSYDLNTYCNGASIENIVLNSNNISYWNDNSYFSIVSGPILFPEQLSNAFHNLVPGTYVMASRVNNCPSLFEYDTIVVPGYVYPGLDVYSTLCTGGTTGDVIAFGSNGIQPYTYEIIAGPEMRPPQNDSIFQGLPIGTYQVRITDDCGNTFVRAADITQYGNGNISQSNACPNELFIMHADTLPGAIYTWNGPNGFFSTSNHVEINPLTINDTGIFSLRVQFGTCLDTTFNVPVYFFDINNINITGPDSICIGAAPTMYLADTAGTWNASCGVCITPTGIFDPSVAGIGSHNLYFIPTQTCDDSLIFPVVVIDPNNITVNATVNDISCNGNNDGSITLNVAGSVQSYLWSNGASTQTISGLSAGGYSVTITLQSGCTINKSYTIAEPSIISIASNVQDPSCFGGNNGQIVLMPSGGTAPYTFIWSNGANTSTINGLTSGSYLVTVTDSSGCTKNGSYALNDPTALSLSLTKTDVLCYGNTTGSISTVVSGGTAPFTYLWSTGQTTASINGLATGSYSLSVSDSNACTATGSIAINQPDSMIFVDSIVNVACNAGSNGAIYISVSGGSSPYTYNWSSGQNTANISGLTAGIYTLTVTDNNACSKTKSFIVDQGGTMSATTSQNNVSCYLGNNGSASVVVSGGTPPYTYLWSNGQTGSTATILSAGAYSVTISDNNGCNLIKSFTITQPTALTTAPVTNNITCNGLTNGNINPNASGGTPSYTYNWSNGSNSSTITNLGVGPYSLTLTDANGCFQIHSYAITQPSPLNSTTTTWDVVCNGGNNGKAKITPSGGTTPYTYAWPNGSNLDSISGLTAGLYQVTLTDDNGCTKVDTAIVNEPLPIALNATANDVSCQGGSDGSIITNVTGAIAPITFAWSNGANTVDLLNVSAGTYSLSITDANACTSSGSFTIQDGGLISSTNNQTNVSCFGGNNGMATVSASGGNAPYGYNWSNGNTTASNSGLTAGNYTVTISDQNGCSLIENFTITEPSIIASNPVIVDVACNGGGNGSISLFPTGGYTPYTYSWSNGDNTQSINNLTAGTYSLTLTDNNACQLIEPHIISQSGSLVVTKTKNDASCYAGNDGDAGISISGGISPYTILWSNGSTNLSISGLNAGVYQVTVNDNSGCQKTESITINQPTDITNNSSVTDVQCTNGSDGQIQNIVNGGTSPYSYNWSNGLNTANINNLTAGNYDLTITDANNCQKVHPFTVNEPDSINITFNTTNPLCNGNNTGQIQTTVSGGTPLYSYAWNIGLNTSQINALAAGWYTLTLTDDNGCTMTDSAQLTQPSNMIAIASINKPLCFGQSNGSASVLASGGTPPFSFLWGANTGNQTNSTATNLPAGIYAVSITDANSCLLTTTINVVDPSPINNVLTVQTLEDCGSSNGQILANASGGTGALQYQWNDSLNQTTSTATNLSGAWYTVSITDANACLLEDSILLPINYAIGGPLVTVSKTQTTCDQSQDGSLQVNPTSGLAPFEFDWSNNPANNTNFAGGLPIGTYSITITDDNGCYTDTTLTITTSGSGPLSTFTISPQSCYQVNDAGIILHTSSGNIPYTYLWNNGSTNDTLENLAPGYYYTTITYAVGCTKIDSVEITAANSLNPSITLSDPVVCFGEHAQLTGQSSDPLAAYSWSTGATQNQIDVKIISDTTIILTLSRNGCKQQTSALVEVNSLPRVEVFGPNMVCQGETTSLSASGGESYIWSTGETDSTINIAYAQLNGSYWVAATDSNGCTDTINPLYVLPTNPKPKAQIGLDSSSAFTQDFQFIDNSSDDVVSWEWHFGDGYSSFYQNPSYSYQAQGSYEVMLITTNHNGCIDSAQIEIIIEEYLEIPNVFTPNGDGMNDDFVVPFLGIQFDLVIYNRWGQAIFQTSSERITWDGRLLSGDPVPEGTYFYEIKATGKINNFSQSGSFTLIR